MYQSDMRRRAYGGSVSTHPPAILPFDIEQDSSGALPGCATIRLEQPGSPVVVLDHPLVLRLEATLRALPRDATGLMLASASERVFIAGADLKAIDSWPDDQLDRYLALAARVFGMIPELPYPTAAAINGAALGGGLELAMHCDGLIGAPSASGKPYPVGLPEAGLSLCPGWGGTNLLPARIDPVAAILRTSTGATMNFDEAVAFGLFDRVASSADQLLPTAVQWLADRRSKGGMRRDGAPSRWIGRPDCKSKVLAAFQEVRPQLPESPSSAAVIAAVSAGMEGGWAAALESERNSLVRLRHTPGAKAALRAFFDRSAAKPPKAT